MGINLLLFFSFVFSFCLIFKIGIIDIKIFFSLNKIGKERYGQKKIIQITNKKKKKNIFLKTILERKKNLELMGKKNLFEKVLILAFILGFIGILISFFTYNIFLAPSLFLLLFFIPFLFVIILENSFNKQLENELESSLSLITNTYLRTLNIEESVSENIKYINYPVQKMFKNFLYETKYVNTNIEKALKRLKEVCQNDVFYEWIDIVILCQEDKTNKILLQPIINKLSDIKSLNFDLDLKMYEPLKDFITMAFLIIVNIPMMNFLNREWFLIYTGTMPGKIIISISFLCIFLGLFSLVKTLKPIGDKN